MVVAFDESLGEFHEESLFIEKWRKVLYELSRYAAGIKIGLPTVASLGASGLSKLLSSVKGKSYLLADLKLADVAHVNRRVLELAGMVGFNGIIAHAFIGLEAGLSSLVSSARELGLEVYAVVAMSHPGAEEVLNRNFNSLLEIALKAGVSGLVVPATQPRYIEMARRAAKEYTLISPGVGAQGAEIGSAIKRGSDFEIVGRAILESEDPVAKARSIGGVLKWST